MCIKHKPDKTDNKLGAGLSCCKFRLLSLLHDQSLFHFVGKASHLISLFDEGEKKNKTLTVFADLFWQRQASSLLSAVRPSLLSTSSKLLLR